MSCVPCCSTLLAPQHIYAMCARAYVQLIAKPTTIASLVTKLCCYILYIVNSSNISI